MKRAASIMLAIAAVLAGTVLALRAGWGASDRATLVARWAAPPSRFVTVDGVPIHVREDGPSGAPVVLLLHGSIVDLSEWDEVAARLKDRYRVVRLDWPPYGLSGPDPRGYSTARAADLVDGTMQALGHPRFALVATSNGANVGLEFDRRHPGHVTAMAFSMLPLERPSQTRKVDWRIRQLLWFHTNLVPNWRPALFWRLVIKDTTPPGFEPPARWVARIHDINNLPGALANQAVYIKSNTRLFKTTDVGAVAEHVTVPMLLQWCDIDDVISQGPAATIRRFTHTRVDLIEYKDFGHFPMLENPDRFTRDLRAFLDRNAAPAP